MEIESRSHPLIFIFINICVYKNTRKQICIYRYVERIYYIYNIITSHKVPFGRDSELLSTLVLRLKQRLRVIRD